MPTPRRVFLTVCIAALAGGCASRTTSDGRTYTFRVGSDRYTVEVRRPSDSWSMTRRKATYRVAPSIWLAERDAGASLLRLATDNEDWVWGASGLAGEPQEWFACSSSKPEVLYVFSSAQNLDNFLHDAGCEGDSADAVAVQTFFRIR
jgi:hypothetical protein